MSSPVGRITGGSANVLTQKEITVLGMNKRRVDLDIAKLKVRVHKRSG